MNDRFLSRGKAKDSGEWVVGLLTYISESSAEITDVITNENFWVDVETLGGCTGLTDKNGKKIFEGDILNADWLNKIITGIVTYSDLRASFALLEDDEYFFFEDDIYFNSYEVIGNIHDNHEMLNRANMPVSNDVFQPVLKSATPENFEIMQG